MITMFRWMRQSLCKVFNVCVESLSYKFSVGQFSVSAAAIHLAEGAAFNALPHAGRNRTPDNNIL